jgi:DNA-binding NarL/FixJ family response regulator
MERISVVLLEEQALQRELLSEVLRASGFEVVGECTRLTELCALCMTATTPRVAVISVTAADPEALERSFEVVRTLREAHPGVASLVLSNRGESGQLQRYYREGAGGVLWAGAAHRSELINGVVEAASGRRFLPPNLIQLDLRPSEPPTPDALRDVTSRERDVLALVAAGDDNLKISAKLDITERTVRAHVSALYRKLNCENRAQLAVTARQLGAHARVQ